ncbi:MAG: hypothetical protein BJ554DRAFT_964 [Olpidium bornovanus]|uniref:Septin-type G domain-containing protein n=1 Tax=Olpidium bornovanus TaxID=278681 RepID=A0A8H7ZSV5_9FUNG|nr:MAG: hypothetical protein BJ554DRAFT_964 [Olpidium bornovanus]
MAALTGTELDEDGVKLSLTVIDTPGFGDALDNEKRCGRAVDQRLRAGKPVRRARPNALSSTAPSFSEILDYIELQYDEILAQESRIKRNPKFQDNRGAEQCAVFNPGVGPKF